MADTDVDQFLYPIQRFKIIGFLSKVERTNYKSIEDFTGLSTSDVSRNIKLLEDRSYVTVWKERNGRYAETVVSISAEGRKAFNAFLAQLKRYASI